MIYTSTSEVKGEGVGRPFVRIVEDLTCHPCQATGRWAACTQWRCQEIKVDRVVNKVVGMWRAAK
jgi:hypothetical protein